MKRNLTCIECPMGCQIEVEMDGGKILSVTGNSCPRGKAYAENEVTCPKRVVTSCVRAENGCMISVKTAEPVEKARMFEVMKKINGVHPVPPVHIGDVLVKNIEGGVDLVATSNCD